MRIRDVRVGQGRPFFATATVVRFCGLRRRRVACCRIGSLMGGAWIDLDNGRAVDWLTASYLNDAAHLAVLAELLKLEP